ncbi:GNAT family N-acetyltransferase [Vibrio harveyi]|nr:GNAT family N-acetyltransferase [Vibrio harveyi]
MELRAFEKEDYELLISWIDSDKLNYLWGGPKFEFPLSFEEISRHCSQPEVLPFIFVVSEESTGYVELFKVDESHFRICRVFVSNRFRGQGISKQMLGQLIDLAKEKYTASVISLAVFEQNTVARNCYESLGFSVTSYEVGTRSFECEEWSLLHMENGYNKAFKMDSQRSAFSV